MKEFKKLVFVLLLLAACNICYAQDISIRGGLNFSQFNYKTGSDVIHKEGTKLNPGFNFGTVLDLPIKSIFSLEAGILFESKGHKLEGNPLMGVENYLFQTNIFYLDIPISFKVTVPINKTKIIAMAGAYTGSALYGNRLAKGVENSVLKSYKASIKWGNESNEYDRFDYGLTFGTGIKIQRYQIGASYELGLKDFSNDRVFEMRNRVFEFYLAYTLKELKKVKNEDQTPKK